MDKWIKNKEMFVPQYKEREYENTDGNSTTNYGEEGKVNKLLNIS